MVKTKKNRFLKAIAWIMTGAILLGLVPSNGIVVAEGEVLVSVTGKVVDAEGNPYEGATVTVSKEDQTVTKETGSDGSYCFDEAEALEDGAEYTIQAKPKREDESTYYPSEEKTFTASDNAVIEDLSLQKYINVTVEPTENGTVSLEPSNGKIEKGGSCTIKVKPNNGYSMSSLKVGDDNLKDSMTLEEDGLYTYELENVNVDKNVIATFTERTSSNVSALTSIEGASISSPVSTEDNVYIYGKNTTSIEVAVSGASVIGYIDSEGNEKYEKRNSFTISDNTEIASIYVEKDSSYVNYTFNEKHLLLLFDKVAPQITFDIENQNDSWKNNGPIKIKGTVNPGMLEWKGTKYGTSLDELKWYKANDAAKRDITVTNGEFEFEVSPEQEGDIDYYVYAKDQAGNETERNNNNKVSVHYDTTAPEVTEVSYSSAEEKPVDKTDTMVISSDDIYINLKAQDDTTNSSKVSGVSKIEVYKNEENAGNLLGTITGNQGSVKLLKENFQNNAPIIIVCYDNAGNKTITKPSEVNSEEKDKVLISDFDFSITMNVHEGTDGTNKIYGKNGTVYTNNKKFTINYQIKNETVENVGYKNAFLYLNNTEVCDLTSNSGDYYNPELALAVNKKNTFKIVVTPYGTNNTIEKELVVFLDDKAPVVKEVQFTDGGDKALETIFNEERFNKLGMPEFGIFYNQAIKVKIKAEDTGAGVQKIKLTYGESGLAKEANVDENGSAVFTLNKNDFLNEEGKYCMGTLQIKATDKVDNSQSTEPTSVNSNIKSNDMMIEDVEPWITCTVPDHVYPKDKDADKRWFDKDVTIPVSVGDEDAGLYRTKITLNDTVLYDYDISNKYKNRTFQSDFEISTDAENVKQNKDGSYVLKVNVVDNAGNEKQWTETIYVDKTNPAISSFEFEAAGYSEGKKTGFGVEKREYGYYFREDTEVRIRATDTVDNAPSSGMQKIICYTVDETGKQSDKILAQKAAGKNYYIINIAANFKGQIYAMPVDNTNHSPAKYVTPDSAILETPKKHNEESHIAFARATSKNKDSKGNELFNKNVPVTVTVTDTYSGIRKVEYSVVAPYDTKNNQSGAITIDNNGEKESGSASGWQRTKREYNLVTELVGTINVANNSNDIIINVKMTDRAGNTSSQSIKFSIDKTAPEIQITYDNNSNDSKFKEFYKKERTATVIVTERNFRAKEIVSTITNKDGSIPSVDLTKEKLWKVKKDKKDPDKTTYTAKVKFELDGKYNWKLSYTDRAQNKVKKESKEKFVIDSVKPLITVDYDNKNAENANYYKKNRTATITIDEHNFEESRVKITGTAKSDGKKKTFPSVSDWKTSGDTHTATILYAQDAEYSFQIQYADKAGNKADKYSKDVFVVDKTIPTIQITGVKNESANKGKVAPVIQFNDVNFDSNNIKITLTGVNSGTAKELDGQKKDIKNGCIFTFNNFKYKENVDDIYTLRAKIIDFAGNVMSKQIVFSVNRFGSVYDVSSLKAINGKYVQSESDIVLTETNVDSLKAGSVQIKVTKNGTAIDLKEGEDYKVATSGGNGKWSKYVYTIYKTLFSGDGKYTVDIYSQDQAGNKNENADDKKKASITFGVDKTAPVITPIDLESDTQYPLEEKEAKIAIKDNLVLQNVKIYLNENEIPYSVDGEYYSFKISSSNSKQNVSVVATDLAGNELTVDVKDFLVSTNLFVRWYNNLPLFVGSLVGIGVIIILIVAIIVYRRRKNKMM